MSGLPERLARAVCDEWFTDHPDGVTPLDTLIAAAIRAALDEAAAVAREHDATGGHPRSVAGLIAAAIDGLKA